jgi:hypothetical protein
MLNLQQRLEAAGVQIEHHESDLYFPVTAESTRIIAECREQTTYPSPACVSTFTNRIEGGQWYDAMFQYGWPSE